MLGDTEENEISQEYDAHMLGHPDGDILQVVGYIGNRAQKNDLEVWKFSVVDKKLAVETKGGLNLCKMG